MIGDETPGTLWRFTGPPTSWLLSRERWSNKLVMYLGEDKIHRSDGVTITNYKFLLDGQPTLVDRGFLKFFKEAT